MNQTDSPYNDNIWRQVVGSTNDNDSGLKAPSNSLNNVINKMLNVFENNYKNHFHKKKIRSQIVEGMKKKIQL